MPIPVSVQEVASELDLGMDETSSYLNRLAGEIFSWHEEWGPRDEEDDDLSDYPDWQREAITRYRQVCDSDDWLDLPSKFDINEWDIVSRYCETVPSEHKRERLRDAIHRTQSISPFQGHGHKPRVDRSVVQVSRRCAARDRHRVAARERDTVYVGDPPSRNRVVCGAKSR